MKKRFRQVLSSLLSLLLIMSLHIPAVNANGLAQTGEVSQQMIDRAYALNDLELFLGTGAGFSLERQATRMEGLVMLIRLLGNEDAAKNAALSHAFKDVPTWGSPYVGYAAANGIANGMGGDMFGATLFITANHYTTFVLRALGYNDQSGDFKWNHAVEKACELGIVTPEQVTRWNNNIFIRGDMVDISYMALRANLKGSSQTLCEKLVEKGLFSEDSAKLAGVWTATDTPVLTLSASTTQCVQGDTLNIAPLLTPSTEEIEFINWYMDNPDVATVANGIVEGRAPGSVTITAEANLKSGAVARASMTVTVTAKTVPIETVSLGNSVLTLTEGDQEMLSATLRPADATAPTLTWSSSDASVVSVSAGQITALKQGTAVISVTAAAGGKSAQAHLTVTVVAQKIPVTGIVLDSTPLSLTQGDTHQLKATVSPSNASNHDIRWSSNRNDVATVENGLIRAVSAGTATITATSIEGNKTASVTVTVAKKAIPVQSVSLNSGSFDLTEGQSKQVSATVSPSNADNKQITWKSSNTSVATVDGGNIKAKAPGSATITASAGGKSASLTVTVNRKAIPVQSVTLNAGNLTLTEGESDWLTATVSPSNADNKQVTWKSSNTTVATVDNGNIKAKAAGNATITASAGGKSASITVTVNAAWTPPPEPVAPLADGEYTVRIQSNDRRLNIYAGKDKNGTNATLWDKDGSMEQRFRITHVGGGKYRFYAMCSSGGNGRVLDVNRGNSSTAPLKLGLRIDLWDNNDAPAQDFYIKSQGEGWYTIELAAVSNGVITCNGNGNNGDKLTLENYSGGSNQKWAFDEVDTSAPSLTLGVRQGNFSNSAYRGSNPLYNAGYEGQCTWYCWGRAMEKTGIRLNTVGHAKTWLDRLNTSGATAVWDAYKPRENAVAVYGGEYGHVRFVEYVSGDTVYYTEANWGPWDDRLDPTDGVLKSASLSKFAKNCKGYIYLY